MQGIATRHKSSKKNSYWENLVQGNTASYKEKMMDYLLNLHGPLTVKKILDIGCGTCELIFKYQDCYPASHATCIDYDSKVIEQLQRKYSRHNVHWMVQDVFQLNMIEQKFDLIFLLDMIHEVYSFYGRPTGDVNTPINHMKGVEVVKKLLMNVASVTQQGGGIIITDNILCEEDVTIKIKLKNSDTIKAIDYFLKNYRTKKLNAEFITNDIMTIGSHDFCVLLTQYNKIKQNNWDRWNVERLETHQYFTLTQFERFFINEGFALYPVIGTPQDAKQEWAEDFDILEGLTSMPEKRITLLAIKK